MIDFLYMRNLILSLVLATGLVACQHQSYAGPDISGGWFLQRVINGDQELLMDEQHKSFTLIFDEDGNVHGRVVCNLWHGKAVKVKNKLHIETPVKTRKRCVRGSTQVLAFSDEYLSALEKGMRFSLQPVSSESKPGTEQQLLLEANRQRWYFSPQPIK